MLNLIGTHIGMARPQDVGEILSLMNAVNPHLTPTAEYLHWKYFENQTLPAQVYTIRDSKEFRLVAISAAVGVPMCINNTKPNGRFKTGQHNTVREISIW